MKTPESIVSFRAPTWRRRAATAASGAGVLACLFAQPAGAADGRAYERVTLENNPAGNPFQNAALAGSQITWAAPDGDTVAYPGFAGANAPDAERGLSSPVVATRTERGWRQRTAHKGVLPGAPYSILLGEYQQVLPSEDVSSFAFISNLSYSPEQPLPPTIEAGGGVFRSTPAGTSWMSRPAGQGPFAWPEGTTANRNLELVGGSADLGTLFYMSRLPLTSADTAAGRATDANWALYRTTGGAPQPAGVLPDGTTDPGGAVPAGFVPQVGNIPAGANYAVNHSISDDTRSVLFLSPDPSSAEAQERAPQLYRSVDGAPATRLSTVGGSPPPDGVAGVRFVSPAGVPVIATPDHRFVFFSSTDVLTTDVAAEDESAAKVYRYDTRDATLKYLSDLTGDPSLATGNVFAVSGDGSKVLYGAKDRSMRIWRDGEETELVGAPESAGSVGTVPPARFSPDGGSVVMLANKPLDDPGAAFPDGAVQNVYRYDLGSARARCVSCGSADAPQPGAQNDYNNSSSLGFGATIREARAFTVDGKSLFFNSNARLAAADKNDVSDVYQDVDGEQRLISSGSATSKGEYYADSSADGRDVFFATDVPLDPDDNDGAYDLYDARVGGGGFPKPPVLVECTGDACQPGPSAPAPGSAASPTSQTPGPATEGTKDPVRAKPVSVKRVRGSSTTLSVSVSVPGPGRLALSGSGIRATSRSTTRSTTYTVKSRLTTSSRRTLSRRGRFVVSARLRFTPKNGVAVTRRVKLTIKRSKR